MWNGRLLVLPSDKQLLSRLLKAAYDAPYPDTKGWHEHWQDFSNIYGVQSWKCWYEIIFVLVMPARRPSPTINILLDCCSRYQYPDNRGK